MLQEPEPDNDLAMRIGLSWEKREEEAKRVSLQIHMFAISCH